MQQLHDALLGIKQPLRRYRRQRAMVASTALDSFRGQLTYIKAAGGISDEY